MSEEETKIVITEMRKRLKDDKEGSYKDGVLAQLDEARTSLKERLKGGSSPEEFNALNAFSEGLEQAHRSVDLIWQTFRVS